MTLQEKIYRCRKKAGLSQEALAERLGVSRQAVSKWETGEAAPEIGKLALLARTFGVSTDWLLSDEEDDPVASATDGQSASGTSAQAVDREAGHDAQRRSSPQAVHHDSAAWVEAIPGVIGRLLRRYGWLFGVYMSISGAAFTAMGLLIKSMFGQFSRTIGGMTDDLPGTTVVINGTRITSGFSSSMTAPGEMMGNFVLGIGLVLLIGGIVLAIVLKRQSK